jgi:alcohol dehydrogenase (cytochrome c)
MLTKTGTFAAARSRGECRAGRRRSRAQSAPGPFTQAQVDRRPAGLWRQLRPVPQCGPVGHQRCSATGGFSVPRRLEGPHCIEALYSKVSKTMPAGRGGSLDEATYANIVAYVLHANGAAAGSTALTPTSAIAGIGAIASGNVPDDVLHPVAMSAFARAAAGERVATPGSFMLPSEFGLTLEGHIQNYEPVTEAMMNHPPDGDWLMFRRNYQGWSFSPLKQINTANVAALHAEMDVVACRKTAPWKLRPWCIAACSSSGAPVIPFRRWRPRPANCCGKTAWARRHAARAPVLPPKRPAAWACGATTSMSTHRIGMVYALDARSGKEVWKNNSIVDYKPGIGGSTGGVIIIKGHVLVGMTNCGRPKTDDHCYISAYDANTGQAGLEVRHRALTGQPGGDTWGGLPDTTCAGGETWIAGTYDPELNTTYWGTAQAKPWRRDLRGSGNGATAYANSTLALDPDTGKLKWYFSHAPGETFDLDEVFERILIDHGDQKTLMTIGKAGILWKLDRVTGKYLDRARRCSRMSSSRSIPRPAHPPTARTCRTRRLTSGCPHAPDRKAARTGRRRAITSPATR